MITKKYNWVDTTRRLPNQSGKYLTMTEDGSITTLPYSTRYKTFNCYDCTDNYEKDEDDKINVTYWAAVDEQEKDFDDSTVITWHYIHDGEIPKESGYYFVIAANGHYKVLNYSTRHKMFNAYDEYDFNKCAIEVTAWADVPKGPEKEIF